MRNRLLPAVLFATLFATCLHILASSNLYGIITILELLTEVIVEYYDEVELLECELTQHSVYSSNFVCFHAFLILSDDPPHASTRSIDLGSNIYPSATVK